MTSKSLPIIRSNAEFDIAGTLPLVVNGRATVERVKVFCRNLRRKGACSLFLEGLPQLLHEDLQRSGTAYAHVLQSAADDGKLTSESAPFFDAVACADFDTARRISQHSRGSFNPNGEYEEDFLYIWYLMNRFFLQAGEETLAPILARYETLAGDSDDARLAVCRSFADRQSNDFDQALNTLIRQHEKHYKAGLKADEILEEEWATEGQLFVEGLALVRLAQSLSFGIQRNYQFIPSIAIETRAAAAGPDSWRSA